MARHAIKWGPGEVTKEDAGAGGGDVAFLGLHRGTTSPTKVVPDDGDMNAKVRPKPGKAIG